MLRIVTTYTSNASGASRIVAKGAGKQRTLGYDQTLTPAQNHGRAAGVLADALGITGLGAVNTVMVEHDRGRATFTVG